MSAYERYQQHGRLDDYDFDADRAEQRWASRMSGGSQHSALGKLILIILAILIPPLGVFLLRGFRGSFWLNVLLTLLGYLPGQIHAVWVMLKHT